MKKENPDKPNLNSLFLLFLPSDPISDLLSFSSRPKHHLSSSLSRRVEGPTTGRSTATVTRWSPAKTTTKWERKEEMEQAPTFHS
ncbi:unnamed protein product, partial [Linum tenue]